MSDRYEYYDPALYGIDFEIDPFWDQAASGRSYVLTQVGFPSFVLEYVYLKYLHGRSTYVYQRLHHSLVVTYGLLFAS